MRTVNSVVLEIREYKGTSIVSRIKFDNATAIEKFNESKGYHGLTKEHWQKLDTELAKLFYTLSEDAPNDFHFKEKLLNLDEYNVQITISSVSMKALLACFDHATFERKKRTIALDLLIRRGKKVKNALQRVNMLDHHRPSHSTGDDLEYCPQPVSNVNSCIDTSSLLYVPSKIENKASNRENFVVDDDERYSPELTNEHHLPVYKPMPIKIDTNKLSNSVKKKQKLNCSRTKIETARKNLLVEKKTASHNISISEESNFGMLKEKSDGSHRQNGQCDVNQLRCIQLQRDMGKSQMPQSYKIDNESQEEEWRKRKKNTKVKQTEYTNQGFKSEGIEKGKTVRKAMKDIFGSEPDSDES